MLILASTSPRRTQLLSMLGLEHTVIPPGCDETLPPGCPPAEAVRLLAIRKAETVAAARPPEDRVIAADTIVYLDGVTLGKPAGRPEAFKMLKTLSGRTHEVYTGLAVCHNGATKAGVTITLVTFRTLSDKEISDYINTGTPMDKAGAYGVQDRGALFVSHIEGDFFSVMGLPLCALGQMIISN